MKKSKEAHIINDKLKANNLKNTVIENKLSNKIKILEEEILDKNLKIENM